MFQLTGSLLALFAIVSAVADAVGLDVRDALQPLTQSRPG